MTNPIGQIVRTWKVTLSPGALRYRSDARKTKLRAGLIYIVA